METEYRTIDKSAWGSGPWSNECDKRQWTDEATGLPCLIVRQRDSGHLCGYVGVSPEHPLYEVDDSTIDVRVHGGLTFSAHCQESADESKGICHKAPGDDKVWWLGFDCAHCGDRSPLYRFGTMSDDTYRTVDYVAAECAALAKQLAGWNQEAQSA